MYWSQSLTKGNRLKSLKACPKAHSPIQKKHKPFPEIKNQNLQDSIQASTPNDYLLIQTLSSPNGLDRTPNSPIQATAKSSKILLKVAHLPMMDPFHPLLLALHQIQHQKQQRP
ncbi:hypothetical protein BDZ45DRAFT_21688 [Acephala macrosclerotiorum]|nr:hypothetical protein BDZ45DRAFT_21688 [Acephala macrosclerotiorum]